MIKQEDFLEFVAALFEVEKGAISMASEYMLIPQWDSVMHLRLVMELEARFGVQIPLERISELRTLGSIYELISK